MQMSSITNHKRGVDSGSLRLVAYSLYRLLDSIQTGHPLAASSHLHTVIACSATDVECLGHLDLYRRFPIKDGTQMLAQF